MSRRIRHMGRTMTKEEHARWHAEHGEPPTLSPKQHAALMKKLGVTKEQDEEWRCTHKAPDEVGAKGANSINPLAVPRCRRSAASWLGPQLPGDRFRS